jgi:hypothetical protein
MYFPKNSGVHTQLFQKRTMITVSEKCFAMAPRSNKNEKFELNSKCSPISIPLFLKN